ncbi:MAG: ATP-binding protein [Gammaproteobacteria bacterium]|nr:ATP-binding protein [Gammaproteobacteria bacterium]
MNISIRKRLLFSLLSLITVASVFTLTKNYFDTREEIQELLDAELAESARVLLEISAHELYEQIAYEAQRESGGVSEHINTHIHKYQQEIDFQIWTANGRLAVRSEYAPTDILIDKDEVFGDRMVNGERWRVYSVSDEHKTIRVQVGHPYAARDSLSSSISIRLITSFGIILPLMAVLIFVTVGHAMQPLKNIARQIENRRFDNLQPVDTAHVPFEALPMVNALNSLFKRLQNAFDEIVLFTSNAAHELRTPLAAQKVHAQLAMQARDDKTRNEALKEVVNSIDRATHMVEQLLTLSRLDPEGSLCSGKNANLCHVAEEQMSEIGITALAKNIDLSLEAPKDCLVQGEPVMIGILIRNLVENAIRYTPAGGTVTVTITEEHRHRHLIVEDSGPGIPETEYEKVFKRFYRVNEGNNEGTGLGLAMVQRIIEIHRAAIQFGKSRYGGLKVDVCFAQAQTA